VHNKYINSRNEAVAGKKQAMTASGTLVAGLRDPVYHRIATQIVQPAGSQNVQQGGKGQSPPPKNKVLPRVCTCRPHGYVVCVPGSAVYGGAEVFAAPKNGTGRSISD
jgi:hypothetical protein